MEIKFIDNLDENQKEEVFKIINKSFDKKIKFIWLYTKNIKEAKDFIMNDSNFNNGIYALVDNKIAGFIAIDKKRNLFFKYKLKSFIKAFGFFRGFWRYLYNKFISFFEGNIKETNAHIQMIAVSEEFQNNGIGRKLIFEAKEKLKEEGIDKLFLDVVNTNKSAKKLYEKLGFLTIKTEELGSFSKKAGFTSVYKMVMSI